jgi:hypothetical protein
LVYLTHHPLSLDRAMGPARCGGGRLSASMCRRQAGDRGDSRDIEDDRRRRVQVGERGDGQQLDSDSSMGAVGLYGPPMRAPDGCCRHAMAQGTIGPDQQLTAPPEIASCGLVP